MTESVREPSAGVLLLRVERNGASNLFFTITTVIDAGDRRTRSRFISVDDTLAEVARFLNEFDRGAI